MSDQEFEYYCPPIEVISDEVVRGGSFNLIHQQTAMKIDVMILKGTPFAQSEFTRRKKITMLPGLEVNIASAEDVIIKKLDFFREGGSEKHLSDIKTMLAETSVDLAYIQHWVKKLGLENVWTKVS
jgi:hypothetical protein